MLLSVLSPLLSLLLTASSASQPSSWSSLGLLSSQASKRSAEENFLTDDMETSASDNIPETDSYDMADFKSPEARVEPYRRRKKFRQRRRKNRYEPPLVVPSQAAELSDDVLYDRDSGYSPPASPYEAPGYSNSYETPSYESPSYNPSSSYEAYGGRAGYSYRGFGSQPSSNSISKADTLTANSNIYDYDYYDDDDSYDQQDKHDENFLLKALKYLRGDFTLKRNDDYSDYYYDDGYGYESKGKDSFNDFLNALAAFLPIGLFLAAIPPNLIVINSRRKRDADSEFEEDVNSVETVYPFLEEINELGGIQRLNEIECQKKLFCELASMGLSQHGNYVQNALGSAVKYTPSFLTKKAGLEYLFKVANEGDCAEFKCTSY